jgi:hypothetical protein
MKTIELPLANSDEKALVDAADFGWASKHTWYWYEDGHVVRFAADEDGRAQVIYLCNEVMSRARGIPLEHFRPPVPIWRKKHRQKRR